MYDFNQLVTGFDEKCAHLVQRTEYGFTRREAEILILSCHDIDIDRIAKLMSRSPKTILKHRENARRKTRLATLMTTAILIWSFINN